MTQRERERTVRRHLYRYARDVRDVRQYEQSVFGATHNETGIRGSNILDPTARSGIALADPPDDLQQKRLWIEAIDAAMEELEQADGSNERGYVYICTRMFGLDGHRHKRQENRDTAAKVADECFMSVSSMYNRIGTFINIVIYYATQKKLFQEKK